MTRKKKTNRAITPLLLQMEAVECGAAALGIILGYFECHIPLEKLRIDCGVSRDGSRADRIVAAATIYGLKAEALMAMPDDLKLLPMPLILYWKNSHFLVLEGIKNNQVFLNDPETGPRSISLQELNESFSNVAISFSRTNKFKKKQAPKITKSIINQFISQKKTIFQLFISSIISTIIILIYPSLLTLFVDNLYIQSIPQLANPLILYFIIIGIIFIMTSLFSKYRLSKIDQNNAISNTTKLFWAYLKLPIIFFSQRNTGDLVDRFQIPESLSKNVSKYIIPNLFSSICIILYISIMFQYNKKLSILGLTFSLLNMIILRFFIKKKQLLQNKLEIENKNLFSATVTGIHSIETIKASGAESHFFEKWAGFLAKVNNIRSKLESSILWLTIWPFFISLISISSLIIYGTYLVTNSELSIGVLSSFIFLFICLLEPIHQLLLSDSFTYRIKSQISQLNDINNYPTEIKHPHLNINDTEVPMIKLQGDISLSNISFGYNPSDPPFINNFNLNVKPGSRIAIVGPSGCGKSTLAKLIAGLLDPWDGDILYDSKLKLNINPFSFSNSLSFINTQRSFFEDSIKNNITLWDSSILEDSIIRAAKDSDIHHIISSREKGYDSIILENGQNFSGGQLQRIELARAFSTNPSILILDEAMSALDKECMLKIDNNIRKRGCTTIIISNSFLEIQDCNEIILLENGKVSAQGTHQELLIKSDLYKNLVKESETGASI